MAFKPINDYILIQPFSNEQKVGNISIAIDKFVKSKVISGDGFKKDDTIIFPHEQVIESNGLFFIHKNYILQ